MRHTISARHRALIALVALLGPVACTGSIMHDGDHPGAGGNDDGVMGGVPGGSGSAANVPVPMGTAPVISAGAPGAPGGGGLGPAPLRRLNRREYDNAIRDLLGDDSEPASSWPTDSQLSGFDTDSSGQGTTEIAVDQFRASAEKVAARAVASLATILGCDPKAMGEDACGASFIDGFGARAFRRPLAADEKTRLKAVLDFGRTSDSFGYGIQLVIETVLQSASFLYRPELGQPTPDPKRVALTPYEVATRLSFFLNGTTPDKTLMMAAASNALGTPDAIEAQARRLLAKPDAQAVVDSFHQQWLQFERLVGLVKDPKLYPGYGASMVASLVASTRAFVLNAYLTRPDAPFAELLTAPYAFVDGNAAKVYGLPTSTATTFTKATLTQPRAGLLTDATMMFAHGSATETQPVSRGNFIRTRMLCQVVPPPPADKIIMVPAPDPTATTRERYARHRTDPQCAGCHALMDPIGLGFENYDAVGRYRTMENGKPIDSTGELSGTASSNGSFSSAVELGRLLAGSDEVRGCMVKGWLTFALGRGMVDEDEATTTALEKWLATPDAHLRDLLVTITKSEAFRLRPPAVVEACR